MHGAAPKPLQPLDKRGIDGTIPVRNKPPRPQHHHIHRMAAGIGPGDLFTQHLRMAVHALLVPHTRAREIDHIRDPGLHRRLEHVERTGDIQIPKGIDIFSQGLRRMVRHIVHAMPSGHMHDAVNGRQPSREPGAIEHGARHIPAAVVARRRNIQPYRRVPARFQLGREHRSQIARAAG